jgi:thymidine kinase
MVVMEVMRAANITTYHYYFFCRDVKINTYLWHISNTIVAVSALCQICHTKMHIYLKIIGETLASNYKKTVPLEQIKKRSRATRF